jgi:hypothetical protein
MKNYPPLTVVFDTKPVMKYSRFLKNIIVGHSIFTMLLTIGCKNSNESAFIEILNKAGKNKEELLKVIEHYKLNEADSLKLKAAYYLIENIEGLPTLDTIPLAVNEKYFNFISKIDRSGLVFPKLTKGIDSINSTLMIQPAQIDPRFVDELSTVKSEFLIKNIDSAFSVWQNMPWSTKVSFEDFCEYILPYRCTDTYSDNIRDFFLHRYRTLPDSIRLSDNMTKVGEFIIKDIQPWFKEDPNILQRYPFLTPTKFSDLLKGRVGSCNDANSVRVAGLRAMGVRAAFDEIPNWGNSNLPHFWYRIIDPEHDTVRTKISNENVNKKTSHIISASSYDEPLVDGAPSFASIIFNRSVPKVYRRCFSKQKTSLASIAKSDDIPDYFRSTRLKDVTSEYVETADITINLNIKSKTQKYAYLCVFDNQEWLPVAWSIMDKGNVIFNDLGKNIVYLPMYYEKGRMVPAADPFLLNLNGEVKKIAASQKTELVTLHTKFPLRPYVLKWESYMIGSRFQLANKNDLSDSVTIKTINQLPFYGGEFTVKALGPFRFLVYQFKGLNYLEISELEFYGLSEEGKEIKLTGTPIGNPGYYPFTWAKLFDSIPFNFYRADTSRTDRFVGLDLGVDKKALITRVKYMPYSDDNGVRSGDTYELFYWNEGWNSLGTSIAEAGKVQFNNAPKGALLLLKNADGGVQQRIFRYKDGKQEFW